MIKKNEKTKATDLQTLNYLKIKYSIYKYYVFLEENKTKFKISVIKF